MSALWGVLAFGELAEPERKACFGVASVLMLGGALLLAAQVP